ncbi:MAG: hypothetical protein AB7O04_09415 [Hyphomonadaceae bacterium]
MKIAHTYRRMRETMRAWRRKLPPFGIRRRLARAARMAAAFVLTLALLGAAALVFVAAQSRAPLDRPSKLIEAEEGRSEALQAVERIFALRRQGAERMDDARLFAPDQRRARIAALHAGAEGAAFAYLRALRVRSGGRDTAVSELRRLLESETPSAARLGEAVSRLNAAVARERVRLSLDESAYRRTTALAADALDALADDLAAAAQAGRPGFARPQTDELFHRARGAAFGWALILRGAALDAEADQTTLQAALQPALAALDRAALDAPLFLFNGPRGSATAPNHLAPLALDLALAARDLRIQSRRGD